MERKPHFYVSPKNVLTLTVIENGTPVTVEYKLKSFDMFHRDVVERYILQTAPPRNEGNEISALIFVLTGSCISARTIIRWCKARREYRRAAQSQENKQM